MIDVVISATGLFTPKNSITNDELVESFNRYIGEANSTRAEADRLPESSAEFILKASGIKKRFVMDKEGIIDPRRMRPRFSPRSDQEVSLQVEMGLAASRQALASALLEGQEIEAILVACSNQQRAYPALAIELQQQLGAKGFAYDLNVACSSATFGIAQAASLIKSGFIKRALVVSPEICTGHLNFRDRDSHFIFGDACTAVVVESAADTRSKESYAVLGCKLETQFSNNIRNNRGFLSRCEDRPDEDPALLFYQQGRKVFKEVTLMVTHLIEEHLAEHSLEAKDVTSFWLHQANASMNQLIVHKLLGRKASEVESPMILDEYANTSSAGSVIAFHKHHGHLLPGNIGVLCSFGAGYSIGSIILKKLS